LRQLSRGGYDETPNWLENQRKLNSLMLDAVDELTEASGDSPEEIRAGIEEMAATVDTNAAPRPDRRRDAE